MKFIVDKNLYSREALTATIYRYLGEYDVFVDSSSDIDNNYTISIEKNNQDELAVGVKESFIKDLIDQQVRLDIEARFGHIRDLIVEEAFKPITKR